MPIKLNARILFKNITTLGFTHGKARINTLGLNYFITLGLHMPLPNFGSAVVGKIIFKNSLFLHLGINKCLISGLAN